MDSAVRQLRGAERAGIRMLKRRLWLALLSGVAAQSLHTGLAEANGGELHIGNLSGTASVAVLVAVAVVVTLIATMFLLRWRELARESKASAQEDGADTDKGSTGG